MPIPISELYGVGRFTPSNLAALELLHYSSATQLAKSAFIAPRQLNALMGFDVLAELKALGQSSETVKSALEAAAEKGRRFKLGARLDKLPLRKPSTLKLAEAIVAPLPPSVNLIPSLPPIRDQKDRETCVAFATLGAIEIASGPKFSPQFLYAMCKETDGDPQTPGTWLSYSFPILTRTGVCLDATWAYDPNPIAGNEGELPIPASANAEAPNYRTAGFVKIEVEPAQTARAIKVVINNGKAVAVTIPTFPSWYPMTAEAEAEGVIQMPLPNEAGNGGHAITLVGYNDDARFAGGGLFYLRNSWGPAFGVVGALGPGYGTIPYDYVSSLGAEFYYSG